MVGKAVLAGSGNRGGRAFQVMAVALTYCAIVMSNVPFIVKGMMDPQAEEATVEGSDEQAGAAEATSSAQSGSTDGQSTEPAPDAGMEEELAIGSDTSEEDADVSAADLAWFALIMFGLILVSPFLAGFENIIGLFIIGIGLYQAWVGARSQQVEIAGPFSLGEGQDPIAKTEGA